MKKRIISLLVDGMLAGFIVSIGCSVYFSCDNKVLGALLFSFGLFIIVIFRLGLFTGKVGYIATRGTGYIPEVFITLIANFAGNISGAVLLGFTRFGEFYSSKAIDMLEVKFQDNILSSFTLSFFCGVLMYIAVESVERCMKNENYIGMMLAIIMPVMIFVFCNFNHSVADFTIFSISKFYNWKSAVNYFPVIISGNTLGGMMMPLAKKLSENN